MASPYMTMEELHRFVDFLASRDPVSSDSIITRPNTSLFLGGGIHIEGGLSSETARAIMVRCVFPPNTQSRHAVIHMKLSMTEEDLASKLYEVFDIQATGGVITTSISVWLQGLCPFINTLRPSHILTDAGYMVSALNFSKAIELLGATNFGIIELVVISEQQFAICPSCNHQGIADAAMLQCVRKRCIHVRRLCVRCLQQSGAPSGANEVYLPGGIRIQAIRG